MIKNKYFSEILLSSRCFSILFRAKNIQTNRIKTHEIKDKCFFL